MISRRTWWTCGAGCGPRAPETCLTIYNYNLTIYNYIAQDLVDMWGGLRSNNPKSDLINKPGSTDGCWIWRMHKAPINNNNNNNNKCCYYYYYKWHRQLLDLAHPQGESVIIIYIIINYYYYYYYKWHRRLPDLAHAQGAPAAAANNIDNDDKNKKKNTAVFLFLFLISRPPPRPIIIMIIITVVVVAVVVVVLVIMMKLCGTDGC